MLATPVAAKLRQNFPHARITLCTHGSLKELLSWCSSFDDIIEYRKDIGIVSQRNALLRLRPDLTIDLAGSFKSWQLTLFSGARVLRYKKKDPQERPIQHAVDNFLATLAPLSLKPREPAFPTLLPDEATVAALEQKLEAAGAKGKTLIGLVPGVGALRPHRAWPEDNWQYLARSLLKYSNVQPILIGGPEESELCTSIQVELTFDEEGLAKGSVEESETAVPPAEEDLDQLSGCLNFAGRLSLKETAAMLKLCRVVVSGDTGPAHVAVAAGTPVIGLYGPTFAARSGPYGCENLVVERSSECQCHDSKACTVEGVPPDSFGQCMGGITLGEVTERLTPFLT